MEYAPEGLMQEYNNMEDEGIDDIAGEEENPGVTYVHENGVYVVDGDMVLEYKLDLTGEVQMQLTTLPTLCYQIIRILHLKKLIVASIARIQMIGSMAQ